MKEIPLTQGFAAIVDDCDYEELMRFKWYAQKDSGTGAYYARRTMPRANGKQCKIQMHRQILDTQPGQPVDHANHDTLDNRRANIRKCTPSQNQGNRRKRLRAASSQFKGVYRRKDTSRWCARIRFVGNLRSLGYFDEEVEAARAYNVAASELFGEFALLNIIE